MHLILILENEVDIVLKLSEESLKVGREVTWRQQSRIDQLRLAFVVDILFVHFIISLTIPVGTRVVLILVLLVIGLLSIGLCVILELF